MQDKCENSVGVRTFYENQSQQDQKIFSPGMFHAWQDRGDMENLQFEFLSRNETLSADTYVFRNWNVLPMEAKTRGETFFEYQLQECGFISRSSVIKLNN